MREPVRSCATTESHQLLYPIVMLDQRVMKNRFVMRNPVTKYPNRIHLPVQMFTRLFYIHFSWHIWKPAAEISFP